MMQYMMRAEGIRDRFKDMDSIVPYIFSNISSEAHLEKNEPISSLTATLEEPVAFVLRNLPDVYVSALCCFLILWILPCQC
jgi:hypothetical protein